MRYWALIVMLIVTGCAQDPKLKEGQYNWRLLNGQGDIELSWPVQDKLAAYHKEAWPENFIVSHDGRYASYTFCPDKGGDCRPNNLALQDSCNEYGGRCSFFALKGKKVWKGHVKRQPIEEYLPELWCDEEALGSQICLMFALKDHFKCDENKVIVNNKINPDYAFCREQLLKKHREIKLDPATPNVVACYVGFGDYLAINAKACYERGGEIRTAYRPIAVLWEGHPGIVTGLLMFQENVATGKVSFEIKKENRTCNGSYQFASRGSGNWQVDCGKGLSGEGTFKAAGVEHGSGQGQDNQGNKISFVMTPMDFDDTGFKKEPAMLPDGGRGI